MRGDLIGGRTVHVVVDPELAALLAGVRNRSAFIRDALRARQVALCPRCGGSGVVRPGTALTTDPPPAGEPPSEPAPAG